MVESIAEWLDATRVRVLCMGALGIEWTFDSVPADFDELASIMFTALHRASLRHERIAPARSLKLAERRCRVGLLLLEGCTQGEAADRLGVHHRTVKRDVQMLREALDDLEPVIAEGAPNGRFTDDDAAGRRPPGSSPTTVGQQHTGATGETPADTDGWAA